MILKLEKLKNSKKLPILAIKLTEMNESYKWKHLGLSQNGLFAEQISRPTGHIAVPLVHVELFP